MFGTKAVNTPDTGMRYYHSSIYLIDQEGLSQGPQNFWHEGEIIEMPSSRNIFSKRRTFSSCALRSDEGSRRIHERKEQRDRKHQDVGWWGTYGLSVNRAREAIDDVRHDLQLAARLHNRVLEYQDIITNNEKTEVLDPPWIQSTNHQSPGDEVVKLKTLRKELELVLAGVAAFPWNRGIANTDSLGRESTLVKPKLGLSALEAIAQRCPPHVGSGSVPERIQNYVEWPDDQALVLEDSPMELQEILRSYLPREIKNTKNLDVS